MRRVGDAPATFGWPGIRQVSFFPLLTARGLYGQLAEDRSDDLE